MNVDETIQSIAKGDVRSLKSLYEQFRVIVYSVVLSILKSKPEAEDVLQETFLRIYDKAATYQPGTNPKAWIISIARNLAYDVLRRNNKVTSDVDVETVHSTDDNIQRKLEITEALFQLGETERQIVVMHVIAGLKHAEISKMFGMPAGTVRWKYRQSLARLATILGGDLREESSVDIRAET